MNQIRSASLSADERSRLEKEIVEISEIERRRMGREFHDGLGQKLTGVSLVASILAEKLEKKGLPEASDARRLLKMVQEAVRDARSLARGLFPIALRDKGLVEAVDDLLTQVRETSGLDTRLQTDDWEPLSDASTSTHIFRIVQEAVNNAVKHSAGTRIEVVLKQKDRRHVVLVEDDGTGMPSDVAGGSGMGLRLMNHRAQLLGGDISLSRTGSGGCVVELTF